MRRPASRVTFPASRPPSVVGNRSSARSRSPTHLLTRFGLHPPSFVIRLLLALPLLTSLACNTLLPPRPAVEWDHSPEAVVLRGTFCCGLVPQYYAENYIPEVLIWGDGRIVWVDDQASGTRRVSEGTFTEAELAALLQRFVDAGFFGWADSYANYNVTDLPTQCLHLNLLSVSKSVCEYYEGAPAAFHTLYAEAASGAGAEGTEFVPTEGLLTVFPAGDPSNLTSEDYLDWDPAVTGLSLADVTGAAPVDGNALALAWRAVNRSAWSPLVREGETFYYLVVTIPGLNAP